MVARSERLQRARVRQAPGETRWDEVVGVAAEVFSERGYRAATLDEIASRLGLLKGSLYHYITSKEDLLFEILKRSAMQGIEVLSEDDSMKRQDASIRLANLIRNWMRTLESLPSYLNVPENDIQYLQGEKLTEVTALRRRIGRVAFDIIQAGVASGSFDKTVNPYVATNSLFRLLIGTTQWYRPDVSSVSWDELTEWYIQLMLGGLGARTAR